MSDLPFPDLGSTTDSVLIKQKVTKQTINLHAASIMEKVESGDIDALDLYAQAKIVNELTSVVIKLTKDGAISDAGKYGKDDNFMYGCKFEVANGATKYGFDHDDEWNEMNDEMTKLKAKMKEREDKMKKAMEFSGVFDDNGIEVPPARVVGGVGESLRITIPKI